MAGQFTPIGCAYALNYLAGTLDTSLAGGTAFPVYLMLLTAPPTDLSSLATYPEVAATGYARQPVAWTSASVNSSGAYQVSNSASILFGPFTAASGIGADATGCALVTTLTGIAGTPLMYWSFSSPGAAGQNASLQLPIGALTMALS